MASSSQWRQGSAKAVLPNDSNESSTTMAAATTSRTALPMDKAVVATSMTETPSSTARELMSSSSSSCLSTPRRRATAVRVGFVIASLLVAAVATLMGGMMVVTIPSVAADSPTVRRMAGVTSRLGRKRDDDHGAAASLRVRALESKMHRAFTREFGSSATLVPKEVVEVKGKDAPSGAVVFAPQVILEVLSMLREGADREMLLEMTSVLNDPSDYDAAQKALKEQQQMTTDGKNGDCEFRFGSAIFVDKSIKNEEEKKKWRRDRTFEKYEKKVEGKFSAVTRIADFAAQPEESAEAINAFVRDKTAGRIPTLFAPSDIQPDAKMVVVSAMFFKAKWALPFSPEMTYPQQFKTIATTTTTAKAADGRMEKKMMKTVVTVPNVLCMHKTFEDADFRRGAHFYVTDEMTVAELPYNAKGWNLVVAMPNDPTQFNEFEMSALKKMPHFVDQYVNAARAQKRRGRPIALTLPKFRIEGEVKDIKSVLGKMGIRRMFSIEADFSKITKTIPLFVYKFVTSAVIEVVEEGTTAAGAAAAALMERSALVRDEPKPQEITFDKPFWAAIRYTPPEATSANDDITVFQLRITNPLPLQKEFKEAW